MKDKEQQIQNFRGFSLTIGKPTIFGNKIGYLLTFENIDVFKEQDTIQDLEKVFANIKGHHFTDGVEFLLCAKDCVPFRATRNLLFEEEHVRNQYIFGLVEESIISDSKNKELLEKSKPKNYFFYSVLCINGETATPKHWIGSTKAEYPSVMSIKAALEQDIGTFEELVIVNFHKFNNKEEHDAFAGVK